MHKPACGPGYTVAPEIPILGIFFFQWPYNSSKSSRNTQNFFSNLKYMFLIIIKIFVKKKKIRIFSDFALPNFFFSKIKSAKMFTATAEKRKKREKPNFF